jgi:hypothetical protein
MINNLIDFNINTKKLYDKLVNLEKGEIIKHEVVVSYFEYCEISEKSEIRIYRIERLN